MCIGTQYRNRAMGQPLRPAPSGMLGGARKPAAPAPGRTFTQAQATAEDRATLRRKFGRSFLGPEES